VTTVVCFVPDAAGVGALFQRVAFAKFAAVIAAVE
jgi:hypothetical protein